MVLRRANGREKDFGDVASGRAEMTLGILPTCGSRLGRVGAVSLTRCRSVGGSGVIGSGEVKITGGGCTSGTVSTSGDVSIASRLSPNCSRSNSSFDRLMTSASRRISSKSGMPMGSCCSSEESSRA